MDRKALGKGLGALIQQPLTSQKQDRVENIPLDKIIPNQYQPREKFEDQALRELEESIREKGVIQPIIVRRSPNGYELIAGQRRWEASKKLKLETIPAIVKEAQDQESLELSLIENIQREDLTPIEEARAYKFLMDKFNLTQEKISQMVGKSRPSIANTLRLLGLPQEIQEAIKNNKISMAHGRLLLEIPELQDQIRFYKDIIDKSLTIRELESLTRKKRALKPKRFTLPKRVNSGLVAVQDELQNFLGSKVRIAQGRKRGRIQIEFYSFDDLKRIIELIVSR